MYRKAMRFFIGKRVADFGHRRKRDEPPDPDALGRVDLPTRDELAGAGVGPRPDLEAIERIRQALHPDQTALSLSWSQTADKLNRQGVYNVIGRPWTNRTVKIFSATYMKDARPF
jgi:hypothetical protein